MTYKVFHVEESIIMWAFRYCLGRKTYAVSEMVDCLKGNWSQLSPQFKYQVQNDIRACIHQGQAGMTMDVKKWQEILEL